MNCLFAFFGHKLMPLLIAASIISSCAPVTAADKEDNMPSVRKTSVSAGSNSSPDNTPEALTSRTAPMDVVESFLDDIYNDYILELETWYGSVVDEALKSGRDKRAEKDTSAPQEDNKSGTLPIVGITAATLLAALILWAVIPRKNDPLVPLEEFRKSR